MDGQRPPSFNPRFTCSQLELNDRERIKPAAPPPPYWLTHSATAPVLVPEDGEVKSHERNVSLVREQEPPRPHRRSHLRSHRSDANTQAMEFLSISQQLQLLMFVRGLGLYLRKRNQIDSKAQIVVN